ncbi:hypothetical protein NIES2101_38580 [Calothrix sp. HK-06]|nr:hypothetical protein NIES2101_38580 [Calothrix sp. HK-06]
MSILIANLGTSDLAVKIHDNYFPLEFRREPNTIYPPVGSNEEALWKQGEDYVKEFLCDELEFTTKPTFRDLTGKILKGYQENPDYWHKRLSPGRIWGVITTAKERFAIDKVYCFVTDQPQTEVKGYPTDTINLFHILQQWFKYEEPTLTLIPKVIPQNINPTQLDALFEHYYTFFNEVSQEHDKILISTKGGTGQMQTALQMQAIASMVEFQANLDPVLDICKVLHGKPSFCKLNAHWKYIRSQRYITIKKLLQRWDFDGSIQLLKDWQQYLQKLQHENITDSGAISINDSTIKQVIAALNIAVDCFNLDNTKVSQDLNKPVNILLRQSSQLVKLVGNNSYDRQLNLYTQCRIYWQLNQIANFLSRLASFCEETFHFLIEKLEGLVYFPKNNYSDHWDVIKIKVKPAIWRQFKINESDKFCDNNKKDYRLSTRFNKRNFVDALIKDRNEPQEKIAWQKITASLDKLEYWIEKRNKIVHAAKGVSVETMKISLEQDRKDGHKSALKACQPEGILAEITNISNQTSSLLNKPNSKYVGFNNTPYYIYSDIRDWVITQLTTDKQTNI